MGKADLIAKENTLPVRLLSGSLSFIAAIGRLVDLSILVTLNGVTASEGGGAEAEEAVYSRSHPLY